MLFSVRGSLRAARLLLIEGRAVPIFCRATTVARGIEKQMTLGTDREEIVRRFEALLDAALSSESPPAESTVRTSESVLTTSIWRLRSGGQ